MSKRPFWYLRRKAKAVASEVDEELNLHLEMKAEALRSRGMPIDEARREALRQFGDLERTRQYCRRQDEEKESHKPDDGTVYSPMRVQSPSRFLVVRTHADPLTVVTAVRQTVRELEPGAPLSNVATIDDLVTQSLARPQSLSILVGDLPWWP